jgi:hypothetical protein
VSPLVCELWVATAGGGGPRQQQYGGRTARLGGAACERCGKEPNPFSGFVGHVLLCVLCPESVLTNYRRFSSVFCYGDAALFCAGALDDVEFALAKRALIKPA